MSNALAANRREDLRLITGKGRYVSDRNLPGQLHAAFLRSDRAHAEIVAIDATPALARPGVRAVFTGEDAVAAGYVRFPFMPTFVNRRGESPRKANRPALAYRKVRFVGEVLAMVVAESAFAAQDAIDAIRIEYRDLKPAVTTDDALAPDADALHDDVPGNLVFEWESGESNAVEQAFARAAQVTRIDVVTTRVVPSPMEPRAYAIRYDAIDGAYDIWTHAQGTNVLRHQFSVVTGLPVEKIRLQLYDVGGSFGQRSSVYPEHFAMMLAARKLGRPVKWVCSRSEGFLSDMHGRSFSIHGELALDRDGVFLGARYRFDCDMGAYLTPTGSSGHLRNVATCMAGVYRTPALYGQWRVVHTNASPIGSYRGAGRPDIAYVVERLVDKAAHELKMDRAELRRRNFIPIDAFPYKTMTGGVYEKSDFAGCMAKALVAADWAGFESRRADSRRAGKLRGIGIATVIEVSSGGRIAKDQIALEFDAQGRITLYTVAHSTGQGQETSFTQVVAQTLGVAEDMVGFRSGAPGKDLIGSPSGGSRAMAGAGSVCKLAALKLIDHAKPFAAEALEVEPSQVEFSGGVFSSRDSHQTISLEALAKSLAGAEPHPLNVIGEGKVGSTFPNGCHIAEVEIDPDTGVTRILSYVAADDCGRAINHFIVEGQVHGGVVQGAGQIFGEHAVYDKASGQLLSGSFGDYIMPRAGLISGIQLAEHPVPSSTNVLGAKGVGESGCTASLPALANAVMDALRPLGVPELDMPFTPSKLWHAIRAARVERP